VYQVGINKGIKGVRSLCVKCDDITTWAWSGHHLRPDRIDRIIEEMPVSVASVTHCSIHDFSYLFPKLLKNFTRRTIL